MVSDRYIIAEENSTKKGIEERSEKKWYNVVHEPIFGEPV
jgi:hypothetical protein